MDMGTIPNGSMLDHALAYHKFGLSLIPLRPNTKNKPAVKWKRYQSKRASRQTVRIWFGDRDYQIAALLGEVSSGLVSRDFDTMTSYHLWSEQYTELAATLPTVKTSRGRHVYAIVTPEEAMEATGGKNFVDFGDGEFRCGAGCYNLLPPSVHPSGVVYGWLVPLPMNIPHLDLAATGFFCAYSEGVQSDTQQTQQTQQTQAYTGIRSHRAVGPAAELRDCSISVNRRLGTAIKGTLPSGPGQRNRKILLLARCLKAIPEVADKPAAKLRDVVKAWYKRALPVIRTKEWEESWIDFAHAWKKVEKPIGEGIMSDVLEAATLDDLPELANEYDRKETRLLVGICRELQRREGDNTFYLGCRTAAELLGVDHKTAARWLKLLLVDGILEEIKKGSPKTHLASEYRYVGGDPI